MRRIGSIKAFFQELALDIRDIKGVFFAVGEPNAAKRLSNATGVQLGLVYPTATGKGGNDNGVMIHRLTLLVLEKNGGQADTADTEFGRYERLQECLLTILERVNDAHAEGVTPFEGLDLSESVIEPIWNLGGWDGWGMDLYF